MFSDEDDDVEMEMSLTAEEQLQRSLECLRDAVVSTHKNLKQGDSPSLEGGIAFVLLLLN